MLASVDVKSVIEEAWNDVIGDTVAGTKNFFVCGGSSLDAVRVSMKISRDLGFSVKPKLIFENPVLEDYENAVLALRT